MSGWKNIGISGKWLMNRCKLYMAFIIAFILIGGIMYIFRPGLSENDIVIYTGYTKTIKLMGIKYGEMWISDDENVATVDDGVITGVSEGDTVISALMNGKRYSCNVRVKKSLSPECLENMEREKRWILGQQLENGAFCNRRDKNIWLDIDPYFASVSADFLIKCAGENDGAVFEAVKKYINWHFAHLNRDKDYNGVAGTIYDYAAFVTGNDVTEKSRYTYDSADSYAAVFLSLLWDYYKSTGDADMIHDHKEDIDMIVNVIFSMQNGTYTVAKPDYPIIYLMDNVEVYAGICAAQNIYGTVLDNKNILDRVMKMKNTYETDFKSDWWREDHYQVSDGNDRYDNTMFYPDVTAQIFPIIYGIAGEEERHKVYEELCKRHNWGELDYYTSGETKFYWGQIFYCGTVMEDMDRAWKYMTSYNEYCKERKYPLYICDAAWVMRGCRQMYLYYKNIEMSYSD